MSGSYLQSLGLNQVKPEHTAASAASSDDGLGDGLDLYTNSTFDFLDADFEFDATTAATPTAAAAAAAGIEPESKVLDLFAAEDMFGDLGEHVVPGPFVGGYDAMGMAPASELQSSAFGGAPNFPMSPPAQFALSAATPVVPVSPAATAAAAAPAPPKGRKKAAATPEAASAADEDKRRRNTAASARFRVKKKQHEQQLKDKTKELAEHALRLEERVRKLEMENELLRGLIIEKNGEGAVSLAEGGAVGFAA